MAAFRPIREDGSADCTIRLHTASILCVRQASLLAISLLFTDCERDLLALALEMEAISRVQLINTAEAGFLAVHGRFGTEPELALGREARAASQFEYVVTVALHADGYIVEARPRDYPKHGRRSFYSDKTALIHQVWRNRPATASDPGLQ